MSEYVIYLKTSYIFILHKCHFGIWRARDLILHHHHRHHTHTHTHTHTHSLLYPVFSNLLFSLLASAILKHGTMNSGKQHSRERFAGMMGPEGKDFGGLFKYTGYFLSCR